LLGWSIFFSQLTPFFPQDSPWFPEEGHAPAQKRRREISPHHLPPGNSLKPFPRVVFPDRPWVPLFSPHVSSSLGFPQFGWIGIVILLPPLVYSMILGFPSEFFRPSPLLGNAVPSRKEGSQFGLFTLGLNTRVLPLPDSGIPPLFSPPGPSAPSFFKIREACIFSRLFFVERSTCLLFFPSFL